MEGKERAVFGIYKESFSTYKDFIDQNKVEINL